MFLRYETKSIVNQRKKYILDSMKIKNFDAKDVLKKVKGQHTEWDDISVDCLVSSV